MASRSTFHDDATTTVYFDRGTGAMKRVFDLRNTLRWTQIEDTFRPLHFGTFGGLTIRILW